MKRYLVLWSALIIMGFTSYNPEIGEVIDAHNGVLVYYNGPNFKHVSGRNMTTDGYNLGLKYQCVEFVKRYYYERFGHKMPNSYGHAKDFFDNTLGDEGYNKQRGLYQYRNVRTYKPQVDDILVYGPHPGNPYGHVCVISEVGDDYVEIVHQNKGKKPRQKLTLVKYMDYYTVADYDVLGWLRLQ